MAQKGIPPSIEATALECPHCGVYTTQTWYYMRGIPTSPPKNFAEGNYAGLAMLSEKSESSFNNSSFGVFNLHLSRCFDCKKMAVWVYKKLVFPESMPGPPPNPDMPDKVRMDYYEASNILNLSPRGASALLRLAIQKLCIELGEKGKNINADIGSLVKKGLSPLIQEALDAVRVIGNEAVHPGTLDLKDDHDTAGNLFRLVNIIVEQMISNPKHVKELYDKIPADKKKAIEDRDK